MGDVVVKRSGDELEISFVVKQGRRGVTKKVVKAKVSDPEERDRMVIEALEELRGTTVS